MAQNNILSTVELIERANKVFSEHSANLREAATSLNTYINSAKLPSDFLNGVKNYENLNKKVDKSLKDLQKTEKQLQQQRLSDLRLQKQREQAFDKYDRQLQREARALEKTSGLYNRVQRGINSLTRQYNDLAIRKELNGKLSAEEEIQLGRLEAKLGKYQAALLKVDSRIGKHQRNVGNYKSTFDGLGFSVAQLSRELPAFANSMQTGFMAISNNIPMLVDEIQRLKRTNLELAASGKPTTNVLRAIGKAIFSLQGMLGVGITLLTVFAPKLIDWATGMDEAKKATEEANKQLEEQNKQLRENIRLRSQQIKDLNSFVSSGALGGLLKRLEESPLGFADLQEGEAILSEVADRLNQLGSKNAEILRDQNVLQSDRVTIARNLIKIEEIRNKLEENRQDAVEYNAKVKEIQDNKEISAITKKNKLYKLSLDFTDNTIEYQKQINKLEEENNALIGKTVQLEEKRLEKKKEAEMVEYFDPSSEGAIKKAISELEQMKERVDRSSEAYGVLDFQIKLLKTTLDGLNGSFKSGKKDASEYFEELKKQIKEYKEFLQDVLKLQEQLRNDLSNFRQGFSKELFSETGFNFVGKLITDFEHIQLMLEEGGDRWEDYFLIISESAQEAFNFINKFSQDNFDAQYERLEQQKNVAIQFAGESAAAREQIEKQYDEKRRQIERRQAQQQKQTAIFNTVINTAQAVVAALANPGGFAGLALSVVMGALGAAKIALISSQSVPQYWMGTENGVPKSGQIMVNDDPLGVKGSNYKEVIEKPNGQISMPQGKNVKMNVPKGTRIYPTYDNFMQSLNHELGINNIGMGEIRPLIVNNGLTKEEIKDVMNEHGKKVVQAIQNKSEYNVSWDENGIHKYINKGQSRSKIMNARFTGRGINV